MKHVFVETNFLVELVRPFPARAAEQLVARNGADVTLYAPWVSVVEAKRTLDRVINEDLGFGDAMMKYAVREYLAGRCTAAQKSVLEGFARQVKRDRAAALQAPMTWSTRGLPPCCASSPPPRSCGERCRCSRSNLCRPSTRW
jgi:hypothetical protein